MRLQVLAMALAALSAGNPLLADDEGHDGKHAGHARGGQRAFCPHCGDACYPTVTKGKETKHCWNSQSAGDQPVAAGSPPVEASLPHSNRRSAPAGFEQSDRR